MSKKPEMSETPSPSPWTCAGPYAVLDAERQTVASCAGPNKAANQRRIAALPELLNACLAAVQLLDDMDGTVGERYLTVRGSEDVRFQLNDAIAE